jgi:SecD/SecF fusion protein
MIGFSYFWKIKNNLIHMKKIITFLIAGLMVVLCFACVSNAKKQKITIIAEPMFVTTDKPDMTSDAMAGIYEERLLAYGLKKKDFDVLVENNKIKITLNKEDFNDDILLLLSIKGEISFWEVYSFTEMAEYLLKTDSVIKNTPQEELQESLGIDHNIVFALTPIVPYGEIEERNTMFSMGYVDIKDTAMVRECLRFAADFFPYDCRFMYTMKPPSYFEDSELLELICLKSARYDGGASISGGVESAQAEEWNGNWQVNMQMDEETSYNWGRMTLENLNEAIAIVIDGKVLSFPVVYQKIEGGKSSISGLFEEQEARLYAAILNSGPLPMDAVLTVQK